MGEGECLDDIAGFGDSTIGQQGHTAGRSSTGGDVESRKLRDSDPRHDPCGANGTGPLTHLDDIGSVGGQEFDARCAGDVARDDGQVSEGVSHHLHHFADSPAVAVSCGDGYAVHTSINQRSDMPDDSVAVDAAILVADRGDGSTAEQSEFRVAGRL